MKRKLILLTLAVMMLAHAASAITVRSAVIVCEPGTENNAVIAAESVSGCTLSQGSVFSFNTLAGPRREVYGYTEAVNGRGETVTGGGAEQVASAIWLCVKDLPDIDIREKVVCGSMYTGSGIGSGANAVIADDNIDFRFAYTGTGYLTIYVSVVNGTIECTVDLD